MSLPDFSRLVEDANYLRHLGHNVWMMDDHRWACLVWEECRGPARAVLIHADYHWDGVYDYFDNPAGEARLLKLDAKGLKKLIRENKYIRFDSFIAPAVMRGLFEEVHFYCLEDDGNEVGLDEKVLTAAGTKQVVHTSIDFLSQVKPDGPVVFDLCLDLFARAAGCEPGEIWADQEIDEFLMKTEALIRSASVVTVSLSFGYSGSEDETRALAQLVVPRLVATRSGTA